jgi:VCBS repeat-containing protein
VVRTLEKDPTFLDPQNLFGGDGISFEIELDGFYHADRFKLELTGLKLDGGVSTVRAPGQLASYLDTDAGSADASPGDYYSYASPANINYWAINTLDTLGLSLTYVSAAPEAVADAATVRRGEAVGLNLLDNDTDADGDALGVFDIEFASAAQETAFLDGDAANGELILETDLVTGFGTGEATFIAPEDFIGEISFGYIARDEEFQSEAAEVTITVVGLPPVVSDDRIVLPFDYPTLADGSLLLALSDTGLTNLLRGWFSFGAYVDRGLSADVLANDLEPDAAEGISDQQIVPTTGPGFVPLTSYLTSNAYDLAGIIERDILNSWANGIVALNASEVARLKADPISHFGGPSASASLAYVVGDEGGAGNSDPATVEIFIADEFAFDAPSAFTVQEDAVLSIDALLGRRGGYGDVQIVSVSAPVALGTGISVGSVEVSGDSVVFTPTADLSGVTAEIVVTLRDDLGSEVVRRLEVVVAPVEDAPELRIVNDDGTTSPAAPLQVIEDGEATGRILIHDADVIADLGDPQLAIDYLAYVADTSAGMAPALAAALDAAAPTLLAGAASVTLSSARGGTLTLNGVGPLLHDFKYTPSADLDGADDAILQLSLADAGAAAVTLAFDIAAVNDAPRFGPDALGAETLILGVGETLELSLLGDVFDPDGAVDASSIVFTGLDPAVASMVVGADGFAVLTGLGSGAQTFTYSVADDSDEAARSQDRTVSFNVNAPPVAVDDAATAFAPGDVILIDAIANDTDTDGATPTYRLSPETGAPAIYFPGDEIGAGPASGLLGTLEWSEADGAFRYVAPADASLFGTTEVFSYDIVDDDGFISRGTVRVELVAAGIENAQLRFAGAPGDAIVVTGARELFALGGASGHLVGAIEDYDGDVLAGFGKDDDIRILDEAASPVTVAVERERTPLPAVAALLAALPATAGPRETPTVEDLFGEAGPGDMLEAFLGSTIVTLSAGGVDASIKLSGFFTDTFAVASDGADTVITYAVADRSGVIDGTSADDDLRGGDGADTLRGFGGDDVLQGLGGDDTLDGGAGRDVLIGGPGRDQLIGGANADLFVIPARNGGDPADGPDDIVDFNFDEGDRIALIDPDYLQGDLSVDISRLRLIAGEVDASGLGAFTLVGDPTSSGAEEVLLSFTTQVNRGPTAHGDAFAVGDAATTDPDANLLTNNGAGADIDPDGDALTVIAAFAADDTPIILGAPTALAGGGVVTIEATGAISFDPNGDFVSLAKGATATRTVRYVVTDGALSDEALATFTITGANDAPTATEDRATTDQNSALTIDPLGNDSDPDTGDSLSVTAIDGAAVILGDIVALAAGGALTVTAEGLTFDPLGAYDGLAAGEDALVSVAYTATDILGASADAAIAITVTGVNDAPEFTSGPAFAVAEGGAAVGTVAAQDVDQSDTLVFAVDLGGDGALFNIDIDTGALSFRAAPDHGDPADAGGNNVYDLSVSVSDGAATMQQAIAVTVTDVIEGGGAGEVLRGGSGDDEIRSGGGALDLAYGGAGADTFVFENIVGERDVFRIRDFTFGVDTLDLNGETVLKVAASARSTMVLLDGDDHDVIIIDGVGFGYDLFA